MKMKNILFGLLIVAPTISYGNGIENKQIPFQMIYETVSNNSTYETLYNSDFVYYLKEQVPDQKFTIGNLFSSCVGYTKIDQNIDLEMCKSFIKSVVYEQRRSITDPSKAFIATTTPDTTEFKFSIYAAGNYTVDCSGENPVQKISITNAKTGQEIKCNYTKPGAYKIIIGGRATGYDNSVPAISFEENQNLAGIDGSLGAIFPTLGKSQPVFANTFANCSGLTGPIPENLFSGISGAPAERMFLGTFFGCSGLTGTIPEKLFSGISGAPAARMFAYTFFACSGLTGTIPENLFSGISGAPAEWMFNSTFFGCSELTGTIPENLFSGISGAPAKWMFYNTFTSCSGLSGIVGPSIFGKITPPITEKYVSEEETFESSGILFME